MLPKKYILSSIDVILVNKTLANHFFKFKAKFGIEKINILLSSINMPHNINRKPTSLEQFSKWKSSELKIFLFYESIPMLIGKVTPTFFAYFSSYVIAMRLLYELIENSDSINVAEKILNLYLNQLEDVYTKFAQTFTAHAHLHLAEQVRQHGSLHSVSQFFFEVNFILKPVK